MESWGHGQEVKLTVRVNTLVHAECWNELERDQTSKGGYAAMGGMGGMGGGVSGVGLDSQINSQGGIETMVSSSE